MRGVLGVQLNAQGVGFIELDGIDISAAVTGVDICTRAGKLTKVTLNLLVLQLEGKVDAQLYLSDAARELLVSHGWTPPAGMGKGMLP